MSFRFYYCFVFLFIVIKVKSEEDDFESDHQAFLGKQKADFDELTMEEAQRRLRLLLPYIDTDKDGFLSPKELEIWVHEKYESMYEDEDLSATFRETDQNFDLAVTWDEYLWRKYGINDNVPLDDTDMLRKHFSDLLARDTRRWKYADVDKNNKLEYEQFLFFSRPKLYEEMIRVVAEEELELSDTNKDGYLSIKEYLESIHLPAFEAHDIKLFKEKYDANKDGRLDVDEVIIWKTPEMYDPSKLEAKHLFDIADDNKDDLLSPEEINNHYFVFVGSKVTRSGQMLHDEF